VQRESRNEQEFNQKLEALQDDIIQNLIDRELIVKEFRKDEKRRDPGELRRQPDRGDADQSVRRGPVEVPRVPAQSWKTLREYRKEVEEDIIYGYMRQQQRKSQTR
jgi:peptidyl-prolyl cis-trans isomerase SurA